MSCRSLRLLLCGISLVVVVGCQPATGSISGKISYQGKPIPLGSIIFVVPDRPTVSASIKDGAYSVDKVPTGEAKVAVVSIASGTKGAPKGVGMPKDKGGPPPGALPPGVTYGGPAGVEGIKIPDHYADAEKSKLRHTVISGKQEFNQDLQ